MINDNRSKGINKDSNTTTNIVDKSISAGIPTIPPPLYTSSKKYRLLLLPRLSLLLSPLLSLIRTIAIIIIGIVIIKITITLL